MQYIVLHAENTPELEQAVNDHLQEGWTLQGGLAVTHCPDINGNYVMMAQAMVIDRNPDANPA